MKKKFIDKRKEVEYLLKKQKIREIKQLDAYKLDICHPDSGGIDFGSRDLYLAIPPQRAAELDMEIVHRFDTFTASLEKCRDLIISTGLTTISMESTSVYWMPLYDILIEAGIEVCLVNPKKFRMVPGRKTDVQDSQWLQTLHAYGLLRGSFHPDKKIDQLRTLMRHRDKMIQERTRFVQRMQKAMTRMNLLLHNVIDDITGVTGMAILKAIVAGERDAKKLAGFRNSRIKASEQEIIQSLTGHYKEEQLFVLKQNFEFYTFTGTQIENTDKEIECLLKEFPLKKAINATCPKNHKNRNIKSKNSLTTEDSLEDMLYRQLGADLTSLPGMRGHTILQIISEVGTDMTKFPDARHFASYLGFVPRNKITGGRVISSRTDRIKSHVSQAFRKVIPSISRSKTALGAFYRRLAPRIGKGAAIIACCRKLSMMFYNALRYGTKFVEKGMEDYKQQQEKRKLKYLEKLAKQCNMELIPA